MIVINLQQADEIIKESKKPKQYNISIGRKPVKAVKVVKQAPEKVVQTVIDYSPKSEPVKVSTAHDLRAQCWHEFNQLKIEQGKEANKIHDMLAANPQPSREAVAELYRSVESYRPQLIALYEKARHVEQYGVLPAQAQQVGNPTDLLALKDKRRKLVDLKCKLKNKITVGEATRAKKLPVWRIEYEQAVAEYAYVCDQILKLEGKL